MKKTFLGMTLVILTFTSGFASAEETHSVSDKIEAEISALVKNATDLVQKEKRNHFSWKLKPGAVASIDEEIKINDYVSVQKVFNLDERERIEQAPDAGSTKVFSGGYFKVLAMSYDRREFVVEHSPLSFSTISTRQAYSRMPSKDIRTTATEVFVINAQDLKDVKTSATQANFTQESRAR